ncbi:acyltransferase [Vibrio sp. LaRot3]|uniref:acyltransferase n=1 Tax=Vibrio sp. LaRot3 TaxID=2998829 RepID=UPI0022CDF032|nr:acyltransferase [Vibrio sp. LaRot3]MDA0149383.1 acyltransferase [Vibrio sp. LaRot3]
MNKFLFKLKARLKNKSRIWPTVKLKNTGNISLGARSKILDGCHLIASRGKITIGDRVHLNRNVILYSERSLSHIQIADGVEINDGTAIYGHAPVTIKEDTLIGPGVKIVAYNHNFDDVTRPIKEQGSIAKEVTIGKGCWLGANSVVLAGVTVGDGVVVAAGSVVTKDIPNNAVVAGAPAKIKKYRK